MEFYSGFIFLFLVLVIGGLGQIIIPSIIFGLTPVAPFIGFSFSILISIVQVIFSFIGTTLIKNNVNKQSEE